MHILYLAGVYPSRLVNATQKLVFRVRQSCIDRVMHDMCQSDIHFFCKVVKLLKAIGVLDVVSECDTTMVYPTPNVLELIGETYSSWTLGGP